MLLLVFLLFFFFSSRRRHTRCSRDWSSDVCSSDLHSKNNTCHRSSSVSRTPNVAAPYAGRGPKDGIAVWGRPRVTVSYMLNGLFKRICTTLWKLAGWLGSCSPLARIPISDRKSVSRSLPGDFRLAAAGPLPRPSGPWQTTHWAFMKTFDPSTAEGLIGVPSRPRGNSGLSGGARGNPARTVPPARETSTVGWHAAKKRAPTAMTARAAILRRDISPRWILRTAEDSSPQLHSPWRALSAQSDQYPIASKQSPVT